MKNTNKFRLWVGVTFIFILICTLKLGFMLTIPIFILYIIINLFIFKTFCLGFLGNVYMTIKNAEKALQLYSLAIKKNTKDPVVFHNYARLLMDNGEFDKAIDIFNQSLNLDLDAFSDKTIHSSLSTCYWLKNDIDKAIEVLHVIFNKYDYISENAFTTMGYYYFLKNDLDKALEYSQKALGVNNDYAPAWDNLGQIYFKQGDIEKAKESLEKALNYDENLVDSNFYLGCVYEQFGDKDRAREYFQKANICPISRFNTITVLEIEQKLA